MSQTENVVGRYAPSPTGDLHLGNVRTALLAWLHCRIQGGQFLLRIEDLDLPRTVAGSAEQILYDLEWLGLDWDKEVVYQSERGELYEAALKTLQSRDLVYPCFCSRKDIRDAASAPHQEGLVYPGTCSALSESQVREKTLSKIPSMRVRVTGDLMHSCGDFVIKRADQLFAYQLAVVVDDLEQGVTDVLRGADLSESTERQLYLARQLEPKRQKMNYFHVPLMMDADGHRMSKRLASLSLTQCRAENKSPEQLVGELAFGVGLIDQMQTISTHDLLSAIELADFSKLK